MARSSMFSIPLVRELALVLVVKLIIIFTLKLTFFSDPVDMGNAERVMSRQLGLSSESEVGSGIRGQNPLPADSELNLKMEYHHD